MSGFFAKLPAATHCSEDTSLACDLFCWLWLECCAGEVKELLLAVGGSVRVAAGDGESEGFCG